MSEHDTHEFRSRMTVRTFRPDDQAAVSHLYDHGLLAGQIAPNDTGADIENIYVAYLDEPANNFWVAELDGRVVGMIGVAKEDEHLAEIRRLRVQKDLQNTPIVTALIEVALQHCKHHAFLKVVLDTRCSTSSDAVQLFDKFGFQHTRTKNLQGKETLEFYLDLYRAPTRKE